MNIRKVGAESILLADRLYRLSNEAAKWAKKSTLTPLILRSTTTYLRYIYLKGIARLK